MEIKSLKKYITLAVHWDTEGDRDYNDDVIPYLTPSSLYLEDGNKYVIDQIRYNGVLPSFASGGYGIRYTARSSCDIIEAYNKVFYLYFERYGPLGRWRYGDEYIATDVLWNENGGIIPIGFNLNGHQYIIGKYGILQMYRMSSRKTDGSGMKYIVKATCKTLRDYNRKFELMLENGGIMTGRWYYEDADLVHNRKVQFSEIADDVFDKALAEEAMGVSKVCARFQITIDITDFLREWNNKDRNGVWLPPEIFEKKIRDGIIYPKDYYPVMVFDEDDAKVIPSIMQWGIGRSWASGVIYNLRCDKLMERKTFEKMKANRCVIPCSGFYEYHKDGKKVLGDYLFRNSGQDKLYLAGLYEPTETGNRYSILTTDANSCLDIHDRMPVILRREECKAWLSGKLGFEQINDRHMIMLEKTGG